MPKGGTLIAQDVFDLDEHERRLRLDGYRPGRCGRCGGRIHAHQHRGRLLLGESSGSTEVAIYRCADRERCGAVWRILPAFLARQLWRAWSTVERAVFGASERAVPAQTVRRWRTRLGTSAALIVATLSTAFEVPELGTVVERAGYEATRREVVLIFDEKAQASTEPKSGVALSRLSAIIHRLAPGVRLM